MPEAPSTVILLHGLGRTARSMRPLARRLEDEGFRTVNRGYPSTCHPIAELAERHVRPLVERAREESGAVHFVTHSLGGILVRAYAARHGLPAGSRAVMLAPPNRGSAAADLVRDRWPFRWWCGPALRELGLGPESVPLALPPAGFEAGVIAGSRVIFPWFNRAHGGPNDGTVAVERARLDGMADFLVLPLGHTFPMRSAAVARHTLHFLRHGRFRPRGAAT